MLIQIGISPWFNGFKSPDSRAMMITHWILKVTDGQAKGLGVWKSRFQSWGRRRVSDPSAKLLPLRGAAQWYQMCKIRHKISSLVAISRIFFKQVSSADWHNFRFRWLHSLHIENLSNGCRYKYDPSQFPRIFLNSFLEGFLLFGPTVRSGLAADGRADVHQSAASSHQA